MSVLRGDCTQVMAGMEPDSIDAIVCDPPYDLTNRVVDVNRCTICLRVLGGSDGNPDRCPRCGSTLERQRKAGGFMGKHWDSTGVAFRPETWAAVLRVAKPGAYLLAFGGTRTVHRMTCALEDAGWVIRDMLVWAYAQGFPKSRASLKPAWEPIVLARKPGASRDLNIDAARIGPVEAIWCHRGKSGFAEGYESGDAEKRVGGRWPANVILTDPILDGGWDGVVGGGETGKMPGHYKRNVMPADSSWSDIYGNGNGIPARDEVAGYGDTSTYSRFFLIPKAPTRERKLSDGRRSPHPTQKPEALIRHLVTLVTPPSGIVLDPFLGSGTLGVVCDGLGVRWLGIEREDEYADWAEDRIADGKAKWEVTA